MRRLSLSTILALGVLAIAAPALGHGVPNNANWHTHDGGAGAHHKPVVFFPDLFLQEGLGTYGVDVEYVDCPNATDKGLLAPGGKGTVHVAGVCMNDEYVIHLISGVEAPEGWETITWGPNSVEFHYRLTPRG